MKGLHHKYLTEKNNYSRSWYSYVNLIKLVFQHLKHKTAGSLSLLASIHYFTLQALGNAVLLFHPIHHSSPRFCFIPSFLNKTTYKVSGDKFKKHDHAAVGCFMFSHPLLGPIRSLPPAVQLLVKWLFPCRVLMEHLGAFSRCSSKYHRKQKQFSYTESINRHEKTGQILLEEAMHPATNSVTVTGIVLAPDLLELSIPWRGKARPLPLSQGPCAQGGQCLCWAAEQWLWDAPQVSEPPLPPITPGARGSPSC